MDRCYGRGPVKVSPSPCCSISPSRSGSVSPRQHRERWSMSSVLDCGLNTPMSQWPCKANRRRSLLVPSSSLGRSGLRTSGWCTSRSPRTSSLGNTAFTYTTQTVVSGAGKKPVTWILSRLRSQNAFSTSDGSAPGRRPGQRPHGNLRGRQVGSRSGRRYRILPTGNLPHR